MSNNGAGAGSIGIDPYTKMINSRLTQLDTKFAIDNQYTPLIGDYSGLRGGSRPQKYILSGNSSSQYPLYMPGAMHISAGARQAMAKQPRGRPRGRRNLFIQHQMNMLQPTNSSGYPSVIPIGSSLSSRKPMSAGRRHTKMSRSLTHPHELDYTTKKGSKVHHIAGHYVRSLSAPYSGGKHSKSYYFFRNAGRELKHVGKEIGHAVAPALPAIGSAVGKFAGDALAVTSGNPELAPLASTVGSSLGRSIGQYGQKKLGGRRKAMHHLTPHSRTPKRRSSGRAELVRKIMMEMNMSLPQASSYIKCHNLY
jgi:hypothetical protein